MAATTQKLSITLDTNELRWLKAYAKRRRVSTSSLLTEAVRRYREEQDRRLAQQQFLEGLLPGERATPDEMDAIEAEWRD